MQSKVWFRATACIGLAACATTPSTNPTLAPILAERVAELQSAPAEDVFGFFTLTGGAQDGDALVLNIRLGPEGQANYNADPARFIDDLAGTFFPYDCSDTFAGPILTNGGTIRLDVFSETGRPLTSISTSTCED